MPRGHGQHDRVEPRASKRDGGSAEAELLARLAGRGRPLLLDGATGSELERAGLATGLPLWSTHALLESPERVGEIHAAYARAGAEIVTANTFRTQRRTLARVGLADQDAPLTQQAVGLARSAMRESPGCDGDRSARDVDGGREHDRQATGRRWVAGSLPPLEDCYRPDLVPEEASLAREHGRQAELLAAAGVDLILIETMNSRREARAAAQAAALTGLPFVVGFVSWTPGQLLSGESFSEAAREVLDLGAASVGVNCVPPASLDASRRKLRTLGVGLLVSPNLGQPDDTTGFRRQDVAGPHGFAEALAPWLDDGASLVGGCCGTTPDHIRALARMLADRAVD